VTPGRPAPRSRAEFCSTIGERLGEDLAATAPSAGRFLLLEQPGPWQGRNAVLTSDLDRGVGRALLDRADAAGVKVHVIRRSARRAGAGPRTCYLACTARGGAFVERYDLRRAADVLELDLVGFAARSAPDPAAAWDRPLYAVCTHGRRDPCCARRGRPLARALRGARPEETWEIGHIGGHRFAATFLAFPWGLAFGRVPAASGPRIVADLERGSIALAHLRGRAGDPWAVQAADVHVRRELGLAGVHDLIVEGAEGDCVALRADGRVVTAVVTRTEGVARPLSCGDEAEPVPVANVALRG
jgi:hypothetical protein